MDLWGQSALLGLVQGLTEFLPVSSSGHLVLLQHFIGFKGNNLLFDLLVHLATLLAVLIYFARDIASLLKLRGEGERRLVLYILVATVVTAFIGFTFRRPLEALFYRPQMVVITLGLTGLILFVGERFSHGRKPMTSFGLWGSAGVGLAQGMAIVPGISRSGTTVSAALLLGMDRSHAGRFSFLIAIPAIFGAFLLEARGLKALPHEAIGPYLLGMGVAFVVGLGSIKLFLRAIVKRRLLWFSLYCWAVAAISLILFLLGY